MHPSLGGLLDWWLARPRPGGVPAWSIELVDELKEWLPSLFVVRFAGEEGWYSLVGTELVERFGFDLTGRTLDRPNLAENSGGVNATYFRCRELGRPILSSNVFIGRSGLRVPYERIVLPFGRDDRKVDRLLGCLVFEAPPETPDWFAGVKRFRNARDHVL